MRVIYYCYSSVFVGGHVDHHIVVLTVHYTQHSECKFLIKHIEDLDKVIKYLEIALLWP